MRIGVFLFSICWLCAQPTRADDSDLNSAVGKIRDIDTQTDLGTGFIVANPAGRVVVITAYHVSGLHRVELDLPGSNGQSKPLRLKHLADLPRKDAASFSIENAKDAPSPVLTWSTEKLRVGEKIAFWGVDFAGGRVFGQRTAVDSLGISSLSDGSPIDFIEFRSDAYRGFSGSPVFIRDTRRVVGIIIQGWYQGDDPKGPLLIYNRAVVPARSEVEILFGVRPGKATSSKQ